MNEGFSNISCFLCVLARRDCVPGLIFKGKIKEGEQEAQGNWRMGSSALKMEYEERQRGAQWQKPLRLNSALVQGKRTEDRGAIVV